MSSENAIGADNQQERLDRYRSRILRGHMPDTDKGSVKIWSELHGDMQSQAEEQTT